MRDIVSLMSIKKLEALSQLTKILLIIQINYKYRCALITTYFIYKSLRLQCPEYMKWNDDGLFDLVATLTTGKVLANQFRRTKRSINLITY
jgi:hypothetical protein